MILRLLVLCALLASPPLAQAQEKWTTYRNTRFGTTIDYPARFKPGRPPDNNDGLPFTADDGASFVVSGSYDVLERKGVAGLEELWRDHAGDEQITYRAKGVNWLVMSGTRKDRIFYSRQLLSHRGEVINNFEISYPPELARNYDAIVARMAKSLRPGSGYGTKDKP